MSKAQGKFDFSVHHTFNVMIFCRASLILKFKGHYPLKMTFLLSIIQIYIINSIPTHIFKRQKKKV